MVRCDLNAADSYGGFVHPAIDSLSGEPSPHSRAPIMDLDNHVNYQGAFEPSEPFQFNSQPGTAWRRHISRIALDVRVSSPRSRSRGFYHRTVA